LITGTVNVRREATIPLVVLGASPLEQEIEAIIDTGFDGYLTLPPGTITDLRLAWLGREQGVLSDGSVDFFDAYSAAVLWDGQPRAVQVEAVDTQPPVGMSLLEGHSLRTDVVIGGAVSITALP
jgi:clan AA aspartic protease